MTFSGVLLVGGESRRMGRDKATIVFQGRPLWERQLQVLKELALEKVFVSARNAPSWLPSGVEIVLDEPPSRGPLSGLTQTLCSVETSHLVVLAVDMPFMTSKQMRILCAQTQQACGVVPVVDGRTEPLAAIYPTEALTDFAKALTGQDFSLQSVVQTLAQRGKVRLVTVADADRDLFQSVNELADLT